MLTRMIPALAVAYWTSAHSAQFGLQMPTRSPGSIPAAMNARARAIDRLAELRVRVAEVLVDRDERLAVAEPLDRAVEVVADRVAQQRRGRRPGCVRRLHAGPPRSLAEEPNLAAAALEAGAVERDRVERRGAPCPRAEAHALAAARRRPAVSPGS